MTPLNSSKTQTKGHAAKTEPKAEDSLDKASRSKK